MRVSHEGDCWIFDTGQQAGFTLEIALFLVEYNRLGGVMFMKSGNYWSFPA
jgi:hypothetical protein